MMESEISNNQWTERLEAVQSQFDKLKNELNVIQHNYQELRREHGTACAKALRDVFCSLLEVADIVLEADRKIVHWHQKSKVAKLTLRCIGLDTRTTKVVEQKSQQLRGRVGELELQVTSTGDQFMRALMIVQELNSDLTEFAISSVGNASRDAVEVRRDITVVQERVKYQIAQTEVQVERARREASDARVIEQVIEGERSDAQRASNMSAFASVVGFGGAFGAGLLACLVCPPLGLAAPVLAAGGIERAFASDKFQDRANELQAREFTISSQLASLNAEIRELKGVLPPLELAVEECESAEESLQTCESTARSLLVEAQSMQTELHHARRALSTSRLKLTDIATQLSDCQYFSFRREIGVKLKGVIGELGGAIVGKHVVSDHASITQMMAKVAGIETSTPHLLRILAASK